MAIEKMKAETAVGTSALISKARYFNGQNVFLKNKLSENEIVGLR